MKMTLTALQSEKFKTSSKPTLINENVIVMSETGPSSPFDAKYYSNDGANQVNYIRDKQQNLL